MLRTRALQHAIHSPRCRALARLQPPQRLWSHYMKHLNRNPVGTKAFTR